MEAPGAAVPGSIELFLRARSMGRGIVSGKVCESHEVCQHKKSVCSPARQPGHRPGPGPGRRPADPGGLPQAHPLTEDTYCLELWHGPTSAFKDMALQILPHLLSASLVKNQEDKTVCILVATSGDTGKAALEGFKDVDRTKILVFYPKDGPADADPAGEQRGRVRRPRQF